MRFVQSASLWGVGYRFRYFINGRRVSTEEFNRQWMAHGHTPESGKLEQSNSHSWRKAWESL